MNAIIAPAVAFPDYAAIEAVNWSTLKEVQRSPLHFAHRVDNPREDTSRLAFGRAVHTAVLEPDRFPLEYVVWDGARRAGAEWSAFALANANRTILRRDEYETALAVRDAVMGHKEAGRLLRRRGVAEQTITWTDKATGLACKARPDWMTGRTLTDLKTTGDVDAFAFGRVAARLCYHGQLGFYRMAARQVKRGKWAVRIIAVEADAPHDVAVFKVPDDVLDLGEELAHDLLREVAECRDTGDWPGKYPGLQTLRMPEWIYGSDSDIAGVGLELAPKGV